ncbi:hypothetical protein ACJJTC_016962 [Scirpophaga incertulas]
MGRKCSGCYAALDDLLFMECSQIKCKKRFHFKCLALTKEKFEALTQEHKDQWICPECVCMMPKSCNTNTPVRGTASTRKTSTPSSFVNIADRASRRNAGEIIKEKVEKKNAAADSSDSDEDNEDQLQKFLDGEDIDTDENDESFKVNTSAEASDSDEESDDEEEENEEETEEDDDDDEEADTSIEAEAKLDTSKEDHVDMSKLSKSQRRRLKKKMQQANKQQPQVNGVEKGKKDQKQDQKADKKKGDTKKDAQVGQVDKKEKKSLSGGVTVEDLKVGSGPVAKPGKVVTVYYEGKLKQNNKMFDNCSKGPGFKFKLGAKEVISGWDVGISGMKVGGKRKIVCPPAMAYGAKGSPPVIPPNSTLVFDVELKNVK